MSGIKRLMGIGAAAAIALTIGAGEAAARDDRGGHKWKHHKKQHHSYSYRPAPPQVIVVERHRPAPRVVYVEPRPQVVYVEPRPQVIYVERPPVYARPEINIVFPLRF